MEAEFQSTLPYGERPTAEPLATEAEAVSIHAPVWGATNSDAVIFASFTVSIHAPVWGATKIDAEINNIQRFQSTLPYGERHACTRPM